MRVVPNRMHCADAAVYTERYPDLVVCCPAGAREQVEAVVPVDGLAWDVLGPHGITCHSPAGDDSFEHIYELPLRDGAALICADTVFHLREHLPGFSGFIARYITASTGFFGVTRLGRLFLWGKAGLLKEWLLEQADRDDLSAIVVGHGVPVTSDVPGHLREAAARL